MLKGMYGSCFVCLLSLSVLITGCGFIKADVKLAEGKYGEAIPIYKDYLTKHPDSTLARNKLGFAYLKNGQLNNSVSEFERVLKGEPGNNYAILYLGMAYLNKKEFGKSISIWQTYRSEKEPLVEAEIKRLLTVVQIAGNRRLAKEALDKEEQLKTGKPDKSTISICYYEDLSPDRSLRAFQKGLAAMLITDMSKIKSLKVVERLRLQALFQEMNLGQTGIVDDRTAPRVGYLLGAEDLLVGNLAIGSLRASTSLVSTSKAQVEGSAVIEVEKDNFYELPKLIVADYAKLKRIHLTPEEIQAIGIPHTKEYQAFIYYGEAVDALDEGRWQNAKDLFAKALEIDPKFDLAQEGFDSTPSPSAPTPDQLASMETSQLSEYIETSINQTVDAQSEADEAVASASEGGDG